MSRHGTKEAKEEIEQQVAQDIWESREVFFIKASPQPGHYQLHIQPKENQGMVCPVTFKFWKEMTPE